MNKVEFLMSRIRRLDDMDYPTNLRRTTLSLADYHIQCYEDEEIDGYETT